MLAIYSHMHNYSQFALTTDPCLFQKGTSCMRLFSRWKLTGRLKINLSQLGLLSARAPEKSAWAFILICDPLSCLFKFCQSNKSLNVQLSTFSKLVQENCARLGETPEQPQPPLFWPWQSKIAVFSVNPNASRILPLNILPPSRLANQTAGGRFLFTSMI